MKLAAHADDGTQPPTTFSQCDAPAGDKKRQELQRARKKSVRTARRRVVRPHRLDVAGDQASEKTVWDSWAQYKLREEPTVGPLRKSKSRRSRFATLASSLLSHPTASHVSCCTAIYRAPVPSTGVYTPPPFPGPCFVSFICLLSCRLPRPLRVLATPKHCTDPANQPFPQRLPPRRATVSFRPPPEWVRSR